MALWCFHWIRWGMMLYLERCSKKRLFVARSRIILLFNREEWQRNNSEDYQIDQEFVISGLLGCLTIWKYPGNWAPFSFLYKETVQIKQWKGKLGEACVTSTLNVHHKVNKANEGEASLIKMGKGIPKILEDRMNTVKSRLQLKGNRATGRQQR